jgi:hypothetical protein
MKEFFRLHGIPKKVISDRDVQFSSSFWKALFAGLETLFHFSTSYHPQTDGQTEHTNQIIDDMLRMYMMDKSTQLEDYLHLVEFTYNKSYQSSTKISSFEILYDGKCMTPINWDNPMDNIMVGPNMLHEIELIVKRDRKNLKVSYE